MTGPGAVAIRCDMTAEQLDLIEMALDQMCWRDRGSKPLIDQTLLEIRLHRAYGERVWKGKKERPGMSSASQGAYQGGNMDGCRTEESANSLPPF